PGISPAMATVRHFTQPSNRGTLLLGIGVVAALALVGIGMLMMRPSTHDIAAPAAVEPAASTNAPATATTSPADEIAAAKHAIAEGRLAPPAQDNALQHYRSALGLEPDNAEAKAGIEDILLTLEEGVTQAIQARDAPAATRALATLRQAQSDYPQLAPLSEQIVQLSRALSAASSKPAAAAKIAPPPVVAAVPNAPNIKLARARIASGQWLTPEGDSALTYLRAARTQNEEGSVITILATDLGSRLLDQSRAAIAGGDAPQARARYNDAISLDREFDLSLPGALEVGKELDELTTTEKNQSANQLKELLAPAIKQRESGQLIEPAGNNAYETIKAITTQYGEVAEVRAEQQRLVFTLLDHARTAFASGDLEQADLLAKRAEELVPGMSATETLRQQVNAAFAKRTAATSVISAGSLRRTREIPATYPPEARVRNIEGWVDLEFTVAADGSTRDIEVKAAQPANTFDKAASDALRRWRFEPVLRDNEAVDQRARIRMQFSLK
ncbi:MAG: energy transducer TonB, partial [Povalibacter sp.]